MGTRSLSHFEVETILGALQGHSRVSMFTAPTMLTRLVHAPAIAAADLRNLRTIFYGGGPMCVADLDRALQFFGRGSTTSTAGRVTDDDYRAQQAPATKKDF